LKKSATEAHRLLVEAYAVLSERSCRKWFQKFKNGEFDVEDKESSGRLKVNEDAELEALLDEDSPNAKKTCTYIIGETQQTISYRFEIIGNDSKARELGSI